jgi:hypothetical protein
MRGILYSRQESLRLKEFGNHYYKSQSRQMTMQNKHRSSKIRNVCYTEAGVSCLVSPKFECCQMQRL